VSQREISTVVSIISHAMDLAEDCTAALTLA
jgi:hypothetical protein